ncbi:MAG: hypothetical protein KJ574_01705 [Nanoarchaeota archaeon]|nr:hypothetical protein [Nanoarchaeota archaeon]
MEVPQYSIKPNVNRLVALKIIQLIILAVLFYIALWLNLQLGFNLEIPFMVNILVIVVLVVAVVIELIKFHVVYAQYNYLFYTNRVIFQKKDKLYTFYFKDFEKSELKSNLLDKIMGTGTIVLSKKFKIGPINKPSKVYEYLLKLIDYDKKTRSSYEAQQKGNQEFFKQTQPS